MMLDKPSVSWSVWLLLTIVAWLHVSAGLEEMPAHLATHFGAEGRPNGWMSPGGFAGFEAAMWGVMTVSFWGPRYLLKALPTRIVNVPHREYWLAPERSERAIARMSGWLEGFGAATLVGLIALNEAVFRANLLPEPRLSDAFVVGLVAYLGGTVVWALAFRHAFRLPEDAPGRG